MHVKVIMRGCRASQWNSKMIGMIVNRNFGLLRAILFSLLNSCATSLIGQIASSIEAQRGNEWRILSASTIVRRYQLAFLSERHVLNLLLLLSLFLFLPEQASDIVGHFLAESFPRRGSHLHCGSRRRSCRSFMPRSELLSAVW